MASLSAIQATLGTPTTARVAAGGVKVGRFSPVLYVPRRSRNVGLVVRSMAENDDKVQPTTPAAPMSTPVEPKPAPPRKPKVSTSFGDVLAFSGPAPERINGRLAMIGFVAAMAVELSKGQDVLSQISEGGVPWFLGASVLFTAASLVPLFKGVTVESKSKGLFTSDAELWNGRFAMLGLVALAFTEFVKGGALI